MPMLRLDTYLKNMALVLLLLWTPQMIARERVSSLQQYNLLIHPDKTVPSEALQTIQKDLQLSGRFYLQANEQQAQTWLDYRQQGYDYLLLLSGNEQELTLQMLSPWQCEGDVEQLKGPFIIERSYQNIQQKELRQIAHQMSDEIMEKVLKEQGFASYPIAYVASAEGEYQIRLSDIYQQDTQVLFTSHNPVTGLSWSPDALSIAFIELAPRGATLKQVKCRTHDVEDIAQSSYVASPIYSIDQRYLYYISADKSTPQVFQHNLMTGEKKQITHDSDWILDLNRGSDANHLLMSSDRSGTYQIYELNIINEKVKRLTFNSRVSLSGVLSPSRQSLFYCELSDSQSLMVEHSFTESYSRYVTLVGESEQMSFAPYSDLIVYEQCYQGHQGVVIKSLHTGQEVLWSSDPSWQLSSPCWAPQPLWGT